MHEMNVPICLPTVSFSAICKPNIVTNKLPTKKILDDKITLLYCGPLPQMLQMRVTL
jgi:hypothetical protein